MAQQISIEAALDGYRRRAEELFHENVLLKARMGELEAENERLQADADEPAGANAAG
ncbi:hypothetical protein ACFWDI_28430 [Streptomyces sp. NPDC060064]|uniref:hypothetical protein n=1 Tax=Streptomyces sp. NPDC060064 TaxID=3347049 RepID=UPI0036B7C1ED